MRRCLSAAEETPEHEGPDFKLSLQECLDGGYYRIAAWDEVAIRGQGLPEKCLEAD